MRQRNHMKIKPVNTERPRIIMNNSHLEYSSLSLSLSLSLSVSLSVRERDRHIKLKAPPTYTQCVSDCVDICVFAQTHHSCSSIAHPSACAIANYFNTGTRAVVSYGDQTATIVDHDRSLFTLCLMRLGRKQMDTE